MRRFYCDHRLSSGFGGDDSAGHAMNQHDEVTSDRRLASSLDIARLIDQSQSIANNVQSLVATVNGHETRIAVLETRFNSTDMSLRDVKVSAEKTLSILVAHTEQEDRDRTRLLVAVIMTLLAVLGGIGVLLFPHLINK